MKHQKNRKGDKGHKGRPVLLSRADIAKHIDKTSRVRPQMEDISTVFNHKVDKSTKK